MVNNFVGSYKTQEHSNIYIIYLLSKFTIIEQNIPWARNHVAHL